VKDGWNTSGQVQVTTSWRDGITSRVTKQCIEEWMMMKVFDPKRLDVTRNRENEDQILF
jgi:hypothetical protein